MEVNSLLVNLAQATKMLGHKELAKKSVSHQLERIKKVTMQSSSERVVNREIEELERVMNELLRHEKLLMKRQEAEEILTGEFRSKLEMIEAKIAGIMDSQKLLEQKYRDKVNAMHSTIEGLNNKILNLEKEKDSSSELKEVKGELTEVKASDERWIDVINQRLNLLESRLVLMKKRNVDLDKVKMIKNRIHSLKKSLDKKIN